jgi:hypothetical protein
VAKPIKFLGKSGFSMFKAVWIATTPPTKNEINETIPMERMISVSMSVRMSFFKIDHFVNFSKILWSIRK